MSIFCAFLIYFFNKKCKMKLSNVSTNLYLCTRQNIRAYPIKNYDGKSHVREKAADVRLLLLYAKYTMKR